MAEFITRNHGNENFKIIIKTDGVEHYKANYSMREIEQMYIAKGWNVVYPKPGENRGFVTITFRHNPQMKPSETDSDK